eukprot:TRINITY_DN2746_c1_g1_i1.p1 TRINITY_DN2746_c1_g1~~TRINITY_DN2746_c1_g1_i1.p1  ORF type:complete len:222 (-),score=34.21 TRINITY_DN2746_c1_g1_i1:299-964(-)
MDTLSFENIFGNVSSLEEFSGLNAITINGITLAVLIILCMGDVLICLCGTIICCCIYRWSKAKSRKSYQLQPVQRNSTHTVPMSKRLSRLSTTGGVEMVWVQNSQPLDIPNSDNLNTYPIDERYIDHKDHTGYVPMASATYKDDLKNYDDVMNVNRNFYSNAPNMYPDQGVYDDVMNQKSYSNAPNMNPDKGVYDDVTNVKPAGYENVLSVRMEQYNDRLI